MVYLFTTKKVETRNIRIRFLNTIQNHGLNLTYAYGSTGKIMIDSLQKLKLTSTFLIEIS
jgi:hypothetical protein